jgi:hypothetical protein
MWGVFVDWDAEDFFLVKVEVPEEGDESDEDGEVEDDVVF